MLNLDDKQSLEVRKSVERWIKANNQAKGDILQATTPIKAKRKNVFEDTIDKFMRMGLESRAAAKSFLQYHVNLHAAGAIREKLDGEMKDEFDDLLLAYRGQMELPLDLQQASYEDLEPAKKGKPRAPTAAELGEFAEDEAADTAAPRNSASVTNLRGSAA